MGRPELLSFCDKTITGSLGSDFASREIQEPSGQIAGMVVVFFSSNGEGTYATFKGVEPSHSSEWTGIATCRRGYAFCKESTID